MANMMLGSIYKHRTFCYSGNQVAINTRYFLVFSLTGSFQPEQSVLNLLDADAAPLYKVALATPASYIGSDIQNITGARPYPIQVGTNANQGNGTGGAVQIPGQVSGIYTLTTLYTGRAYRGRSYIPFPATASTSAGVPPTMSALYQGYMTDIATAFSGLSNVSVGGSTYILQWGLYHREPETLAGTFTASVNFRVGNAWATQKRRGDFGRPNPSPVP